jgi:hypothetical protein
MVRQLYAAQRNGHGLDSIRLGAPLQLTGDTHKRKKTARNDPFCTEILATAGRRPCVARGAGVCAFSKFGVSHA